MPEATGGPSRVPNPSILDGLLGRWRKLTSGTVNRQIFGAAMIIGVMTMGFKLVSLLKESVIAASFGTGSAYDAFIVALLLPSTIVTILSGSLNAALIPTYIEIREKEDSAAAQRLYTTILMWNTILLVGLTLFMAATVQFWLPAIASGFDPAKLALTRKLVYWSLPMVVLTGFSTTWGALLNAGEKFALVAIAPVVHPLSIILMLGLFCRSWGIFALLGGEFLGILLEMVILGVALTRRGHSLIPCWHGVTDAFRKVRSQYAACIAAAFLVSGMGLVDQAFASTLGPRSNSALNYGSKLVTLVLSLGSTALGTAILPQLSRMVANCHWSGIRRFLRFYSWVILGVTIPLSLGLIVVSTVIIKTMYQHGSFTAQDTDLVVKIQIFYILRIPFSTFGVLVTRTLTALRANHILFYFSIGSFVINAGLDYLFIQRFGIAGVTLSTSVCSAIILVTAVMVMYWMLDKRAAESPEPA